MNKWDLYSYIYDFILKIVGRKRQNLFRQISFPKQAKIYVAGCGTGLDFQFLPQDCELTATDFSVQMLKKAKINTALLGLNNAQLSQQRAEISDLADNSQDVVILHLILAVTDNPQALMNEAFRIVKPDGKIMIWDKFLPDNQQASIVRKLINIIARPIATSINLQLAPLLANLPHQILFEQSHFAGLMKQVILTKE